MLKEYSLKASAVRTIAADFAALLFILIVPAVSHFTSLPVYYFEPMRLTLVILIIYTNRYNALAGTAAMPFFSHLFASHPTVFKTMLISTELMINAVLFFILLKKTKKVFLSMITSILISKIIYYGLKHIFISYSLIDGALISTPIYYQIFTTILYGLLAYFLLRHRNYKF